MSDKPWSVLELLRWTTSFFAQHEIPSARLDAEVLLAHVLATSRMQLYLSFDQPVSSADRATFRELVRRRAKQRVPVAYLVGRREFWSLSFRVTPDVLIPRPETEVLVQAALELDAKRIADVGVGSGCVAVALASEKPDAEVVGVDASEPALKIAQRNADELGICVALRSGDALRDLEGMFDLIVSNPPYIATEDLDGLPPEVLHEPRLALDGGPDGLDVIRALVAGAPPRLNRPGHLALEVGAGQAPEVLELARLAGASETFLRRDLAQIERVVVARWD